MVQTAQTGRKLIRAPLRTSRPVYVLLTLALSALLLCIIGYSLQRVSAALDVFMDLDGSGHDRTRR